MHQDNHEALIHHDLFRSSRTRRHLPTTAPTNITVRATGPRYRLMARAARAGRRTRSPGEGLRTEATQCHEDEQGEIGQVQQHVLELSTAELHDRRSHHDCCQTGCGQRRPNRRDVEQGGQDEADGAQDLDCSEGLDEAGAEVHDPSPAGSLGQFLPRDNQLVGAGQEEDSGQESGNDAAAIDNLCGWLTTVVACTVIDDRIVEILSIQDPERLAAMDLPARPD